MIEIGEKTHCKSCNLPLRACNCNTTSKDVEKEVIPKVLYHGSNKKFTRFRAGSKRQRRKQVEYTIPRLQGRNCIYLHEDPNITKRKYTKTERGNGFLYEVSVNNAIPYADAIKRERLKKKKKSLTDGVWIAYPNECVINKIIKINEDGSEEIVFDRNES